MDFAEPQDTAENSSLSFKPFLTKKIALSFLFLCLFLLPVILIAVSGRVKLFKKATIPITSPITLPILCVTEGNSIPVTPTGFAQECCSELILCPPPPGIVGTRGKCQKTCENQKPHGDANNDGRINFSDFSIFRSEFISSLIGNTPPNPRSDFNNDGKVNLQDFFIWRKNFLRSL